MSVTIEIDKVEEVVNRQVKGGRITGLAAWEGKTVKILVMESQSSQDQFKNGRRKQTKGGSD